MSDSGPADGRWPDTRSRGCLATAHIVSDSHPYGTADYGWRSRIHWKNAASGTIPALVPSKKSFMQKSVEVFDVFDVF